MKHGTIDKDISGWRSDTSIHEPISFSMKELLVASWLGRILDWYGTGFTEKALLVFLTETMMADLCPSKCGDYRVWHDMTDIKRALAWLRPRRLNFVTKSPGITRCHPSVPPVQSFKSVRKPVHAAGSIPGHDNGDDGSCRVSWWSAWQNESHWRSSTHFRGFNLKPTNEYLAAVSICTWEQYNALQT